MAKEERVRRRKGSSKDSVKAVRRRERVLLRINLVLATAIVIVCFGIAVRDIRERNQAEPATIVIPDWIQQDLLVPNPYSRAGEDLTQVRDIVIHYVANKGTSEQQNRNYFNNLAYQKDEPKTSASSHFIIGLDGTILLCVPLGEVAYANYPRNFDTISIECCHPDDTGEFTAATKEALIRLTAWLCDELDLSEKNVIRHYDVSGKACPKYYVEHVDEWKQLKKQMKQYRKRGT